MASEPLKVFISYSHDSPEHARRVLVLAERLRKDGIDAQIDQYVAGTPPEGWPRWMLDRLDWAEFVLVVCTETYYRRFRGHEEPRKGKGADWEGNLITLEMYDAKTRTTKFAPVFFASQDEQFVPEPIHGHTQYLLNSEENYTKLYAFLTGQAGVTPGELGPLKRLARNPVEPSRFESSKEQGRSLGKLHGVPELPPHYLPPQADLTGLKRKLLAGVESVAVTGAGKFGVQGMGGIGKTVLAAALAHDSEVRQAFPDGIYWLTIGQKPNLLDFQNQLLRQLTSSKETLTTEQEAKDALREALKDRSALVVVDDAWTIDHADAFSVTAPPARLLITTRNNEVLVGIGAEEHRVDVLSPSDGLKMLAEWVGQKSPNKLSPEAAEVARECGYLPLALAMIGAMIRFQPTAWKDALDCLRASDLEDIKRAFPSYPYPNLLRAIEVSVEALDAPDRERYLDLAVFPEDQPVPETALSVLWKLDARRTRGCMARLIARSLATRLEVGGSEALILHDLQRNLIRKRREKNLPDLHLRLVEAWDALPKLDSYAWRWIAYHLVQAGRKDDLRRRLLDFNYLEAKLATTDTNALIADYDYIAVEEDLRLIQSAIRLSAHVLASDARQLAGQLTGRLLGNMASNTQALLEQAAEAKVSPWLRPLKPTLTAPGGPLIRTLEGHTDEVRAVAVTPDGHRALSGSGDRTLRLWDLEGGQSLRTLEGHSNAVVGVAITPDGRRAVSASYDGTLRVWNLESGQSLRTLEGHKKSVQTVAVTPDGRRAVSGSRDGTLRVWDLESGQSLCTLEGHTRSVRAVAVTPDGRGAVSSSDDSALRVWDLQNSQTVRTLEGHTNAVQAVAVTPDGRRAVSGSDDQTLRVWDLESGQSVRTLEGHSSSVIGVVITPDGHHAVSASWDNTLRVWDLESGQSLRTLRGHTYVVRAVAVTPDGRRAVSGSGDRTLRLWNLESTIVRTLKDHSDAVNVVAVTPDGHRVVSASDDGTLQVWDLGSGQSLRTLKGHTSLVRAVAVAPDGRRAVSASDDRTLRLWDLESGKSLRTFEGHTGLVRAVAVTPDGRRAMSGSDDRTLRLWDLESGQSLCTLEGMYAVNTVAVTPDGRRAVSGSDDGPLRLWDLESGQSLCTLEGHNRRWVSAVVVTPDGRCAVSASDDQTLRVWDLESGQSLRTLEGHTNTVRAVAVTPDGRQAVSASHDRTLRLWDLESGQTLRTLKGHMGWVRVVAVTPDGRRAVSGSSDQTLRLWDLKSGEEIATFTAEGSMCSCAVAPDGQTIIGGDALGRVHFLRLVEADKTKLLPGAVKTPLLSNSG